jgi:uncharacterized protein
VVVAFSGGVDSTLLLSVAQEVLDDRVIAATVISPLQPKSETIDASRIARRFKIEHKVYHMNVLNDPRIRKNPLTRCYQCKMRVMKKIKALAQRKGYVAVEASNRSDLSDHRPGLAAVRRLGIKSPLIEAGFEKEDIRKAARRRGLPNWNKPSMACLASRIPYDQTITVDRLRRIEKAEEYIRRLGFSQVRIRDHYPIARIEINAGEFEKLLTHRKSIIRYLQGFRYRYITLDLNGYSTGSLNR